MLNKEKRKLYMKEYNKRYRLKNKDRDKEKYRLYMKEYHFKNKDRRNERHKLYMRKYRAENRDLYNTYMRSLYAKHPEYSRLRRLKRKELLANIKKDSGCMVCGENDPRCLDFHHKDYKTKKFTIGNSKGRDLLQTMKEVEKCIVLCSNCHRKLEQKESDTGIQWINKQIF
jgi:hypothetical protein